MIEVILHLEQLAAKLDSLAVWIARLSDKVKARAGG